MVYTWNLIIITFVISVSCLNLINTQENKTLIYSGEVTIDLAVSPLDEEAEWHYLSANQVSVFYLSTNQVSVFYLSTNQVSVFYLSVHQVSVFNLSVHQVSVFYLSADGISSVFYLSTNWLIFFLFSDIKESFRQSGIT